MTSINQATWDKLVRPSGDRLVARPALPEVTHRLLCALDSKGNRHLLIALGLDDVEFNDLQSRGVAATTRDLVIQGKSSEKYLDIECLDVAGHSIFDLIGGEISDELLMEEKQPKDIVQRVLAKWRRFWGQLPQQMLSKEEQLGLFAELWFLSGWLIPKFGPDSIMVWRGPWGNRHDYEWPDKSVEVKATTITRGRIHQINSLDQLEKPSNGPLYLFSLVLREEAGATNNLAELIDTCHYQMADSAEALSHFESGLAQVGYSPVHQEEYTKVHLRIVEENLFIVDDDFPRITRESFRNGVQPGVERVEYEINLNTFDHLIRAHQPQDLPFTQP